ncbi:MAG: hypothetical protein NC901_03200 [Candidatus Omnitrophica bacterium]|nr:hypothetical protein [Candidatus Omnitrophota bacterium]
MTSSELKTILKVYLMSRINGIKEVCTFNFPILFPAVIIDEPEVLRENVGYNVLKETFTLKLNVVAPALVDRDKVLQELNSIALQISDLFLSDPSLNEKVTQAKILNQEPTKIILKENPEQQVELVGISLNLKITNIYC